MATYQTKIRTKAAPQKPPLSEYQVRLKKALEFCDNQDVHLEPDVRIMDLSAIINDLRDEQDSRKLGPNEG